MRRILVTGASGFVGRLLVQRLGDAGFPLTLAGRTATAVQGDNSRSFAVGGVDRNTDWRPALEDCDAVIHLAAQVPGPGVTDEVFSEVNDRGTARLVEQAASSGARQFVLMSSLSAVSDNSSSAAINEQTLPEPSTSYGRSKLAGESHMVMFEGRDRIAITIRPPIVYGAGAQGNWLLLQRLAATRVPLPFGSINNCRTLIAAENLVDALVRVVSMPEPKSGTFLVSDGEFDKPAGNPHLAAQRDGDTAAPRADTIFGVERFTACGWKGEDREKPTRRSSGRFEPFPQHLWMVAAASS